MKREEEKSGGFELAWWRSRGADEIISDSEQMLLDDSRLSTGSNEVDNALNGGIPKKILFEITVSAFKVFGYFFFFNLPLSLVPPLSNMNWGEVEGLHLSGCFFAL